MLATLGNIPGVAAFRTHGGSFQARGTPDIVGVAHGRAFFIEAKRAPGLEVTEAQGLFLDRLDAAGAATFVSADPKCKEVVEWVATLPGCTSCAACGGTNSA